MRQNQVAVWFAAARESASEARYQPEALLLACLEPNQHLQRGTC